MNADTFTLDRPDGATIHAYRWLPEGDPTAIVQIAHGMAEHAGRYERFADALTEAGYAVYAEDHRGHGRTGEAATLGHLADHDGWDKVVEDLAAVTGHALGEHPGLPVVLFGHSMGSFLTRTYLARHGSDLSAAVICGTAGDPGVMGTLGRLVARTEAKLRGARHTSTMMNKLTFGAYNSAFKPNRTDFDWLSRDNAEVDKYIDDPLCGFVCTSTFYVDLLGGLAVANRDDTAAAVPSDLPLLVISGEQDPVGGDNATGVAAVADQLRNAGVTDVTLKVYPAARHELLNETNRDEVTSDVLSWVGQRVDRARRIAGAGDQRQVNRFTSNSLRGKYSTRVWKSSLFMRPVGMRTMNRMNIASKKTTVTLASIAVAGALLGAPHAASAADRSTDHHATSVSDVAHGDGVSSFQAAHGLKVTGHADARTARAMQQAPAADVAKYFKTAQDLDPDQLANARTVIGVGKGANIPDQGQVIALMTAMQESKFVNYTVPVDHDSLGIFQQRPSTGWGTPEQITDVPTSSKSFYGVAPFGSNPGLIQIDGWETMPPGDVCQAVQVSAYPDAYAQWEGFARDLLANEGPSVDPIP